MKHLPTRYLHQGSRRSRHDSCWRAKITRPGVADGGYSFDQPNNGLMKGWRWCFTCGPSFSFRFSFRFSFSLFPSSFIPHVHFLRLRLPSFGVCFLLFIVFPYYSSFLFFFSFFFFFSFSFSFFFLLLFFFFLIPSSSSFFFLALPCSYFFFLVLPCSLFCQTHLTWHLLQVCSTAPQVVLAFIKRNWEATFRVTDKM